MESGMEKEISNSSVANSNQSISRMLLLDVTHSNPNCFLDNNVPTTGKANGFSLQAGEGDEAICDCNIVASIPEAARQTGDANW